MTERRRPRERDRLRDPETGQWDMEEVRHRSKGWVAVAVALAVVFGGVWFVGNRVWDAWMGFRTQDDYIGAGIDEVEVEVPRGANMGQVGTLLAEADVVKSADTFRRYAQTRPDESAKVQAGTYTMLTQASSQAAFERLIDPSNIIRNTIQLREGQRLTEQVAAMAEATELPQADFEAALADPGQLGLPEYAQNRPEGFFFPDTYELPSNPTALDVMRMTVANYKRVAADLEFEAKAAESPAKDPYNALIMASLLEREANRQEDRLKVARVFYNRLEEGMALQSDATVAYAVNKTGTVWTTPQERQVDSPYNTYKFPGMPPGPVTSPSRAAMEAAVNPAEGDWLYFVPINLDTGETEFNTTLADHNRSVAKLQEWCRGSDKC